MNVDMHYRALTASKDIVDQRVAAVQRGRLNRIASPYNKTATDSGGSELPELIEREVGHLHRQSNDDFEGSCPWHASRSGRCLVIFHGGTRWFCRSCRRGGDIVTWVSLTEGVSVREARRILGLPTRPARLRRRRTIVVEVAP